MKKGELMTSQIIGFILLVVSFVIVLWVYSSIAFPDQIDRTTCHESVVLRATLGAVTPLKLGSKFTPLQCKTEKICLGGDCREFEGAKNVLNIKAKEIEDKRDIEKEIVQSMVNCWTMMGEGKVAVFTPTIPVQYAISSVKSTCVICSRIAVSENIPNEIKDEADPMDYMIKHRVPGKNISYYEFFSGDSSGATVDNELLKKDKNIDNEVPEVAVVFMQAIVGDDTFDGMLKKDLTAILAGGAGISQIGGAFVLSKVVTFASGIPVAILAGAGAITQTYYVYHNREIILGYCGDIALGEKEGCSVVRVIPYDVENLKQYCGRLESIS